MKKVFLISAIAIGLGLIFSFRPNWLKLLWGWQILAIPFLAGMAMIFVQPETKSYRFAPKLIIGSALVSFGYAFLLQLIEYFRYYDYFEKPFSWFVNLPKIVPFALFLAAVCIFGGLVGIAIKGAYLLSKINKNHEKI